MAELEDCQERHQVLLVAARAVPDAEREVVRDAARLAFSTITLVRTLQSDERPWPQAPNTMFRCAASFIAAQSKVPFWWNEPDCIPLSSGWLDLLEDEYRRAGKPFMGSIVHKPCTHLTGCAIYPPNVKFYNPAMLKADKHAFDCVQPEATLPHTHHTALFHHQWSDPDGFDVPTFPTATKLSIINRAAVVFHRCKDLTLIERLKEQRALQKNVVLEVGGALLDDALGPHGKLVASEWVGKPVAGGLAVEQKGEPFNKEFKPEDYASESSQPGMQVAGTDLDSSTPTQRPPIYTYHMPIAGLAEAGALLDLWRELWAAQGWDPIVLTEADAATSTQFKPYRGVVSVLPTVNHPAYERACYMRHLAMVEKRGGFLVDYDVIPRRFTPADARNAAGDRAMIFFEPTRVPCAVKGSTAGFQGLVDFISSYRPTGKDTYGGKPHISDMEILRQGRWKATAHCVEHLCGGAPVRDNLGEGWKLAPMIHFSSYSFHKLGWGSKGHKAEWIRKVLAELPPLEAAS